MFIDSPSAFGTKQVFVNFYGFSIDFVAGWGGQVRPKTNSWAGSGAVHLKVWACTFWLLSAHHKKPEVYNHKKPEVSNHKKPIDNKSS